MSAPFPMCKMRKLITNVAKWEYYIVMKWINQDLYNSTEKYKGSLSLAKSSEKAEL